QMQSSTSFCRFVLEHLMRHAEPGREDFPVESGLLPHAPARCIDRASCAAAHVLRCQFFGGDQSAALHQGRGFLVNEVPPSVGNALMQTTDLLGQLAVAVRTTLLPDTLP